MVSAPDDGRGRGAAVVELHLEGGGTVDDVVVRQDQPVGGQDDAGALTGRTGDEVDSTDTTDGSIVAATCSTEPAGAGARFADTVGELKDSDERGLADRGVDVRAGTPSTPPPTPATRAAATVATAAISGTAAVGSRRRSAGAIAGGGGVGAIAPGDGDGRSPQGVAVLGSRTAGRAGRSGSAAPGRTLAWSAASAARAAGPAAAASTTCARESARLGWRAGRRGLRGAPVFCGSVLAHRLNRRPGGCARSVGFVGSRR